MDEKHIQYARQVIDALGSAAVGAALGETKQTVNNWRKRGVPPRRCNAFVALTGADRKRLCPDWADYWPDHPAKARSNVDCVS